MPSQGIEADIVAMLHLRRKFSIFVRNTTKVNGKLFYSPPKWCGIAFPNLPLFYYISAIRCLIKKKTSHYFSDTLSENADIVELPLKI